MSTASAKTPHPESQTDAEPARAPRKMCGLVGMGAAVALAAAALLFVGVRARTPPLPAGDEPTVSVEGTTVHLAPSAPQWRFVELQDAAIETALVPSRIVVPAAAVVVDDHRPVVFVSEGRGRLSRREVRVGGTSGDGIEVLAGLAVGDRYATRGARLLLNAIQQAR